MNKLPWYCSKIHETVIIIILSVIFLRFFGLSTLAKWNRQDVQIVSRKELRDSLPPPAVTICPKIKADSGWKPETQDVPGLEKCKGQADLEECVIKNTFSLDEVVDETYRLTYAEDKEVLEESELINESLWISRMTETTNGMCHTLVYDQHINQRSYFGIRLNPNLTAAVFLHDPNFFVFKSTNVFIPFLKLNDVFMKEFIIIATTKKRMRRESKFDCNEDENYNFGGCVSEEKLRKITGCLLPCSYTQYSLSDSYSFASNNGTEFVLTYALTDHLIEEEVLLFPLDSLVSELGGALGLFLGFSFLGAVDMIQTWAKTFLSMVRQRLQREAA